MQLITLSFQALMCRAFCMGVEVFKHSFNLRTTPHGLQAFNQWQLEHHPTGLTYSTGATRFLVSAKACRVVGWMGRFQLEGGGGLGVRWRARCQVDGRVSDGGRWVDGRVSGGG